MKYLRDFMWFVGFMEGEGCFRLHSGGACYVLVTQVQGWPLEKCAAMFGGKVNYKPPRNPNRNGHNEQAYGIWQVGGRKAVSIMMMVYPFMSPDRQKQIGRCLDHWKSRRVYTGEKQHCPQGHPYEGSNLYRNPTNGQRKCRICTRANTARLYRKNHPRCAQVSLDNFE